MFVYLHQSHGFVYVSCFAVWSLQSKRPRQTTMFNLFPGSLMGLYLQCMRGEYSQSFLYSDVSLTRSKSHIEVNPEHHGNLFFWHFENRHIANRKRTVIWLNGGPGCSSMDGALMEIGPYRVRDKERLVYNEGAWDEFANLLFIDNPVGTGFSYVDTDSYVHELKDMADQLVIFLEKFFAIFPEHENNDVSYLQ